MKKEDIFNYLPHRYPFLFVDDIISVEKNIKVVGIKNISNSEMFLQSDENNNFVLPNALLIEVMAQIGGFVFYDSNSSNIFYSYLSKAEKIKFLKKVYVGDRVIVEGKLVQNFANFAKVKCIAKVANNEVAEGEITYYIDK